MRIVVPILVGMGLIGCGSSTTLPDGTEGAGGGTSELPVECQAANPQAGKHPVEFRFVNNSTTPVYALELCQLDFKVTSCADGYKTKLNLSAPCTEECRLNDCGECGGACGTTAIEISSTEPRSVPWAGETFVFSKASSGCPCHEATTAPSGRYRASISVYGTPGGPINDGEQPRVIDVDFELPAADGVVTVDVTSP